MEKIRMSLVQKVDDSYDIIIGKDIIDNLCTGLSNLGFDQVAVVTDSNVKELYGDKFLEGLKKQKINAVMISFNAGEKSKSESTKARIDDLLVQYGFRRDSVILALGGGVVGDMAGFVASTYMRGVPYLQIPTTLLAMVDSSIGGKTAINTKHGKNLIGTFYQPKKVVIDVSVLGTLSKEEMLNGMAEMIKHAIIGDERLFVFIEGFVNRILDKEEALLIKGIYKSLMVKKDIVEKDEKELGIRKALNFGHTIGHAIEKASDYKVAHGNAVAMGMVAETKIAEAMKLINPIGSEKIIELIKKSGLPVKLDGVNIDKVIENIKYDKKVFGGKVMYTLPRKVGRVDIDIEVDNALVSGVLGEMK